jgi:hypothetical protein
MDPNAKVYNVAEIAASLVGNASWLTNGPWTLVVQDAHLEAAERYAQLRREDGAALNFYLETYPKPRLKVTGEFPRGAQGVSFGPREFESIGVSPDKPSHGIANDINRRLIPRYLEAFAKALAQKEQYEAKSYKANLLAEKLAGILGDTRERDYALQRSDTIRLRTLESDFEVSRCGGIFEVSRCGGIKITIHTDRQDVAETIAHALAGVCGLSVEELR